MEVGDEQAYPASRETSLRFRFQLTPLAEVTPWTTRRGPRCLHWFGLTDGWYWIELGTHELLRYSPQTVRRFQQHEGHPRHPYVDYYVARFWEDLIQLVPPVMQPVPDDLADFIATDRSDLFEPESEESWAAAMWHGHHVLDLGYLSTAQHIRMWRTVADDLDDGFFTLLGPARCTQLTHISSDAAGWMNEVIATYCPHAVRAADPYHVVTWATEALDEQRRIAWNTARGAARGNSRNNSPRGVTKALKDTRWALWKNPDNLTDRQREQLAWIAKTQPALHRAWALKEGLRTVFAIARRSPTEAVEALDRWISWARRCRLPQFVKLAQRVVRHRDAIVASIEHGLSNALVESMNTKIRLIVRVAFGFHSAEAIIALAMLSLGGHRPTLPRRSRRYTHG
jgi:hypothetical protein